MPAAGGEEREQETTEELLSLGRVGVHSVDRVCFCDRNCSCGASLKSGVRKRWGGLGKPGEGSECEDIRDRQALAGQALLKSTTRMSHI